MSAGPRSNSKPVGSIRIWDLPVRVTHWLIAALFFSWWSAENDQLEWHMLSGYAMLTLVLFRLYWGLIGSSSARFAGFLRGPAAVIGYASRLFARGERRPSVGHNPLGGWSVVALLGFLLAQTILGLFAIDVDGINSGPLDYLVSFETGRAFAHWHGVVFNVLLGLVGLHLAAVAFYAIFKRENLVVPMLTGRKRLPVEAIPAGLRLRSPWFALPGLAAAALIVAAIVLGLYR